MKKSYAVFVVAAAAVLLQAPAAQALNQETELLLILLEQKGIITKQDARNFESTINDLTGGEKSSTAGKVDDDDDDDEEDEEGIGRISDRFKLSGELSVDATYFNLDGSEANETGSDIRLYEAELSVDANIATHVDAHLTVKYEFEEEEEDEYNLFFDDAYILIDGKDKCPMFAQVGKMYLPFGLYESRFNTYSAPRLLGQTNDSALVAGYKNKFVKLRAGIYNGEISEESETNNHVRDWVVSLEGNLPEFRKINTTIGLGYTSNLANSEELGERIISVPATDPLDYTDSIRDYVPGFNAYLNICFAERVSFTAEYVGATEGFASGELDFDNERSLRPWAWSLELGGEIMPKLEAALRYEKTNAEVEPGEHFLAENQYGGLISYDLFDNTTLILEQLFGEYANHDDMTQTTMRVEVEF